MKQRGLAVEKQVGFRPTCHTTGCGYVATVAYQAHPVDRCHGRTAPPDVVLLCGECLRDALRATQDRLLDAFLGLRPGECMECGLTICTLSDIVQKIQPLWIWSEPCQEGGENRH